MEISTAALENPADEQIHKKGRHRKKHLYTSILNQMEFYFSDSNLSKDRFLSKLIMENPYVDINVFLKFNKIRKLTTNVADIKKSLKKSTLLKLSEDENSVCRSKPVQEKTNIDECTVYVERLKTDTTHDWLSSLFGEFGKVVYVSIPKYKHNSAVKGFAFVEFDTENEAQTALNYFESIGCKMPSSTEPAQLCSIATFEWTEKNENGTEDKDSTRKRKLDSEEDPGHEDKKLKTESKEETDESESKKKKKQKKDNKKKNYMKELGLQVLSKKEWKKMRNRYLDMQKKKMSEFKKHLLKVKFSQANYEDKFKKPDSGDNKEETESSTKFEFTEGVIVKIKVLEPLADAKKFKNEIKSSNSEIKYVDIPNPSVEEVYVRFSNNGSAKEFCGLDSFGKKTLLTGEEEQGYWKKMKENREEKFKKNKKKQRGREKLLKKANKVQAKHIKFDE